MNEKEMNNLYLEQDCHSYLSRFRIPAKWTRLMPLRITKTYEVRPIASGIWTGEVRVHLTCTIFSCSYSTTILVGQGNKLPD